MVRKANETDPDAYCIRYPEPSNLGVVVCLIRERDLMVHGGPDLSEAELRAGWGSMDLARDARLALGSHGEAIVGYAAASAGGPGRVDVEFYARPDAANGDAGSRLLRWAERRAGELAADAFSNRSRRSSDVSTAMLQCAVGATDATARGLLESAGYTLARVSFYMEVDLGEETPVPALPVGPEQFHSRQPFPILQQSPPAVPVWEVYPVHPCRQDEAIRVHQEVAVRVHQEVAFAPCQALRPVVAPLGTSHQGGLDDLAVDYARAGIAVTTLSPAHLLAQPIVGSAQPTVEPPLAEVIVDGLPRRLLVEDTPEAASSTSSRF